MFILLFKMKVIVVDVETTGLPINKKASITDDNNWPNIIQISWITMDTDSINDNIIKIYDYIIKLPEGKTIPQDSIKIHGITNERMRQEGVPIKDVLIEFMENLNKASMIIAHNLDFDKKIIKVELYRNKMFKNIQSLLYGPRINFCTMKTGKDICKIIKYSNSGEEYYKFPRLIELHEFLFNEQPRNLHNSLVDILVCLRCFYKMRFDEDLIEINKTFKQIFNQNTSHMIGHHS